MHSLLVIDPWITENLTEARSSDSPGRILSSCGYVIHTAVSMDEALALLQDADASILHLPMSELTVWRTRLQLRKIAPVFWWCTPRSSTLSVSDCHEQVMVDGILSPAMLPPEIHWILHFGARQCFERQQWLKEREQLLSRMEERKWIDLAKGILSKTKNISESEAYDLLRKQAMNERKRLVDVATSIVKVYQLLQDQT
ncbi:ANTAR domain-containing response regulator [Paenibacillus sp. NFR01]|uniref:ANTAR domain-containing response regulator n=1 Tax=Paenibacillus sp. NFR01 TaxID=1566279 RepID=UPI0008D2DD6F|nr:ANTAR domain-containing protein [Paenibacillus sp. NFR01]SET19468.1 response regulator NasT [Paenibacillus sp. NFR01]